jgi:hypothetical protein
MIAHGFTQLLGELGAERSYSRPRVSNDDPFSEAHFHTVKYQPDYPGRFLDIRHAQRWCEDFFVWHNEHHHHSGLALFAPADISTAWMRSRNAGKPLYRRPTRSILNASSLDHRKCRGHLDGCSSIPSTSSHSSPRLSSSTQRKKTSPIFAHPRRAEHADHGSSRHTPAASAIVMST